MPFCRSLMVNGSDSSRGRSSVTQYAVVCISFSGSSSLPAPTFSLVKNLIFLKPTTWERTRTSPWEKEEPGEVKEVKEVEGEEATDSIDESSLGSACVPAELRRVAAVSRTRTWVYRMASV